MNILFFIKVGEGQAGWMNILFFKKVGEGQAGKVGEGQAGKVGEGQAGWMNKLVSRDEKVQTNALKDYYKG